MHGGQSGDVARRQAGGTRSLALPAVIRVLSTVPVRLTALFEPGKRPEVVASLLLDVVRCLQAPPSSTKLGCVTRRSAPHTVSDTNS